MLKKKKKRFIYEYLHHYKILHLFRPNIFEGPLKGSKKNAEK